MTNVETRMTNETRMPNEEVSASRGTLQRAAGALIRRSSLFIRHFPALLSLLLALTSCSAKPAAHPDEAAVRTFLERYFSTWSARDLAGYAACFHSSARVFFVTEDGQVVSEGLTDFLHSQKMAHERAATPMTEKPLTMTIQGDAKVAQAAVTWVLTKGTEEQRGTDFFTLKREGTGWKIVSLVFYGE